jgi:hypothetical protein
MSRATADGRKPVPVAHPLTLQVTDADAHLDLVEGGNVIKQSATIVSGVKFRQPMT